MTLLSGDQEPAQQGPDQPGNRYSHKKSCMIAQHNLIYVKGQFQVMYQQHIRHIVLIHPSGNWRVYYSIIGSANLCRGDVREGSFEGVPSGLILASRALQLLHFCRQVLQHAFQVRDLLLRLPLQQINCEPHAQRSHPAASATAVSVPPDRAAASKGRGPLRVSSENLRKNVLYLVVETKLAFRLHLP